MRCPGCGSELKLEKLDDLEVEACENCHGVWFDAGELGRFLRHHPVTLNAFNEKHSAPPENVTGTIRRCPRCDRGLESYRYQYSSPITIDSCPGCMGIFVGPGEVRQIQEFVSETSKPDPKEKAAMAAAQLDSAAFMTRKRALDFASSVWVKRMSNSLSWWEMADDPDF